MNSITLKKLYTNFLVNPHQYFKTESELENIYNKLIVYLNNLGQTLTVDQQEYIFGKTILKQIKIKNQYYFDTFLSYPNQMTKKVKDLLINIFIVINIIIMIIKLKKIKCKQTYISITSTTPTTENKLPKPGLLPYNSYYQPPYNSYYQPPYNSYYQPPYNSYYNPSYSYNLSNINGIYIYSINSTIQYTQNYIPEHNDFIIMGEGFGVIWINSIFFNIFAQAFPDKRLIFVFYNVNFPKKPDLVLRSTHEWYNYQIKTYDLNTIKQGIIDPINPYFDYTCPYICWSGEPLRTKIKCAYPPLYEFNTYKLPQKDIGPYNLELYQERIWWGQQRYYGDNKILSHWIPFIILQDITLNTKDVRLVSTDFSKKYDFVYIASNCSQKIRENLFAKLKAQDGDELKTRAYGKCQQTHNIEDDTTDQITSWADNYKIYKLFKFVFAIENVLTPGYITEKIYLAFQAGSVPIYYGPSEIKQLFNENSFYYLNDKFVDPYNPTDYEMDIVVNELHQLAADDDEITGWKKFVNQSVYKDNIIPDLFKYNKDSDWIIQLGKDIRKIYDVFKQPNLQPIEVPSDIPALTNLCYMTIITTAYLNQHNQSMEGLQNYIDIFKKLDINNYLYDILVYSVQNYIYKNNYMDILKSAYTKNKIPDISNNNIGFIELKLQITILSSSIINEALIMFHHIIELNLDNTKSLTVKQFLDQVINIFHHKTTNKYMKYKKKYMHLKQNN